MNIGAFEIIQIAVSIGVVGAALLSAIWLIRERAHTYEENEQLRRQLTKLEAVLETISISNNMGSTPHDADKLDYILREWTASTSIEPAFHLIDAPGSGLVNVLKLVFSKRAFDRIFSQLVIDGREEYFEALAEGRPKMARWRLARMYAALLSTVALWLSVSIVERVVRLWRLGS